MPTFTYQARDDHGRLVKGILDAESQISLADRLRKMGYLVTRMEELTAGLQEAWNFRLGGGVPQETLLLNTIQLANLVEAGVPLTSSLHTVAEQTANGSLREALESVTKEVEGGSTFSQALSHHPLVFPKLMVSLTAVGEASGHLDTVLIRYANFLEKDLDLKRTVQGALLYPVILVMAATILILFLVTFVVPQFAGLFVKAGVPLPLPTQILMLIGQTVRTRWWALALGGACTMIGTGLSSKIPSVRLAMDELILKLPVLGAVIHLTIVARFARTFATLISSGVPIIAALETARGVVENRVIGQEIKRVRAAVEQGERMAASLSVGKVFHPDAIQMVRVGEESGRLDVMLGKIADFYELRVNYGLKQMMTLLEPLLLICMGGVVAFIMASLLLPMFDMVKVLQRGGFR